MNGTVTVAPVAVVNEPSRVAAGSNGCCQLALKCTAFTRTSRVAGSSAAKRSRILWLVWASTQSLIAFVAPAGSRSKSRVFNAAP